MLQGPQFIEAHYDEPISLRDVASGRDVSYADPGYFVRAFRRAHGTTPLRWRRAGRP